MNSEQTDSDEYWVELAKKGSDDAFNKLIGRYDQKIQQIINFYINDHAFAKDLAQEVFIKVHRNLHLFKAKSKFSTWLYKVTQNTIKNYYRSNTLRLDSEAHYLDEQETSSNDSPEHQLIDLELTTQIESAISLLSKELRQCYGMHVFEGCTYEHIAEQLSCPIGTVRSRIHRARKLVTDFVDKRNQGV
ncbi:RNA polymerase sigma factor [Legionella worsleiensis]|uniref:Sigma factor RpoE (Sigma 24) n=1 Tax=Legionella worsleiensis TaxID=45076 RepID=A0A0W1AJC5_9GAMM|nr:sigma-70 family RNA polymerase sigma factor [Legionella worsleiensis]KTD81435.1 sigma factor RpoE (sigma 24) [Legionella worsleiensis]STY30136.1 DNA-directed RNA polymerase specialized sigma subunit [Legionella worsleiensis]